VSGGEGDVVLVEVAQVVPVAGDQDGEGPTAWRLVACATADASKQQPPDGPPFTMTDTELRELTHLAGVLYE
jgi:hypothetical protein